jgi:hypothetical protein
MLVSILRSILVNSRQDISVNITRFESFCDGGCEDKKSFDDLLHDSLKEIS